jgi:iron complex outermembrane receptor protein
VNGTIKRSGDLSAPNYNLSNTGVAEKNISTYLQYKTWKRGLTLLYSLFNTNIGILRATHIGNTTDLANAIKSSEPYYVKDFTYKIESPRQNIMHQIIKADYFERLKNGGKISFQYAAQLNARKEFDVRRGGRSNTPALDLNLQTHTADFTFQNTTPKKLHNKVGVSGLYQNNYNVPGTGFRPVLPNYNALSVGAFILERYKKNRWEFEAGARYDFKLVNAEIYSRNNEARNTTFNFHNAAFSLGGIFSINDNLSLRSNIGSAFRPPNVYELLSDGVHQSAASIEVGDINLKSEQSLKWITTLSASAYKKKMQFEVSPYVNVIQNYILLQPEQQARLTIRGAFPVFAFKQTNAVISGLDFDFKYDVLKQIAFTNRTSFLYGRDLLAKDDLIFMPPVQFNNSITFQTGSINKIENMYLTLKYISVLTQYWYPEGIDFTAPPKGYGLLNIYTGIDLPFKTHRVSFIFQVDNVMNIAYRDYLNRFRYYADNMGRNFSLKIKYHFSLKPKNKQL